MLAVLQWTAGVDQRGHAGQRDVFRHDARCLLQVFDGLEQGHDDQLGARVLAPLAVQQAGFFLQHQHLEQVAHRFGVADDGMADGGCAVAAARLPCGAEDGQLALGDGAVGGVGDLQRARVGQHLQQQALLAPLIQGGIVRRDARARQQLGHSHLMLVGALPQVQRGQVKTKHLHGTDQGFEARLDQGRAALLDERGLDDAQVGQKGRCIGIRVLRRDRMARRHPAAERRQCGCQPGVQADQGASVRLVTPVLVGVGRRLGQGL